MLVPWRVYILILHPIKKTIIHPPPFFFSRFFVSLRCVLDRSEKNTPHLDRFPCLPPGATNAATKHGLERQSRQVGAGSKSSAAEVFVGKPERVGFDDIVELSVFFFPEFLVVSVSGCFFFWGGVRSWGQSLLGWNVLGLLKTGGNTLDWWNLSVENFHQKTSFFPEHPQQ